MTLVRIESARIYCRAFKENDLTAVSSMMSDPDVMKYTSYQIPLTKNEIKKKLDLWIQSNEIFAIINKENNSLIGWAMMKDISLNDIEIGYMFLKEFWGQGFGLETAKILINSVKEKSPSKKIIAKCHIDNQPSINILIKSGMKQVSSLAQIITFST